MPTAIWGESEPLSDDIYPLSLLRQLLLLTMEQFAAQGACLALYDDRIRQMVVRMHLRVRPPATTIAAESAIPVEDITTVPLGRRKTGSLGNTSSMGSVGNVGNVVGNPSASTLGRMRRLTRPLSGLESLTTTPQEALFPLGEAYAPGQGLIGITWRRNESLFFRRDDIATSQVATGQFSGQGQSTPIIPITPIPHWYLAAPILEPFLPSHRQQKQRQVENEEPAALQTLGVIVLYQTTPEPGFQAKQLGEAVLQAERMGLYIQNDRLRRAQSHMNDYIQRLQQISAAFPSNVVLGKLVEDVYQFVMAVVPATSLLLTFYDRDTKKMYDVFAVDHGKRIEGLHEHPAIANPADRPLWWKITQDEQRALLLSTSQPEADLFERHGELLHGSWSDQTSAQSLLLLPMKMFKRVVGSLSITSDLPDAFTPEKRLVLETMVQLITVSTENAKLYDRSQRSLSKAQQRQELLAAMNSALQAISTVLNVAELLHKFVETAAKLVGAEICTFFQLSPGEDELVARAIFDSTGKYRGATQAESQEQHSELIQMIRLPFKQSVLEKQVNELSFFYIDEAMSDELARDSSEGGTIFLSETLSHRLLMIPVHYQTELVGVLALHTPSQDRSFGPEEVSTLQAIASQAASALRNAQLFEEIREANAELRRMDQLKDEFIVTASHELRTPLSAVSGYASMLKRQSTRIEPSQIMRYASKIADAAQQLAALVESMTEATRVVRLDKKLEMQMQMGPVQVLAAAEIAITMVSINIEQKISMHIDPDLWVYCDGMLLRQVLTNLLDNAAKYSPPTGHITLTATATQLSQLPEKQVDYHKLINGGEEDVALVHVCDDGDGIALEDQEKIFEKFVRAPRSLTTPVRGSGLGLFICRRYIEAMGGKLWLEMSIPGEGSIFGFYLSRIDAPIEARKQYDPELERAAEHQHETA